jgi:hypothetical protein
LNLKMRQSTLHIHRIAFARGRTIQSLDLHTMQNDLSQWIFHVHIMYYTQLNVVQVRQSGHIRSAADTCAAVARPVILDDFIRLR